MAFDFHYRFDDEGGCDVICTRCFHNVGHAQGPEALQRLTAAHVCEQRIPRSPALRSSHFGSLSSHPRSGPSRSRQFLSSFARLAHRCRRRVSTAYYLVIVIVLLFYILPTMIETHIARNPNQWFACILIGDLAGCMGIYFILKRHRTAVFLYCILTALESSSYTLQIVSMQTLTWIMDGVPTVFLATQIAQLRMRSGRSQTL